MILLPNQRAETAFATAAPALTTTRKDRAMAKRDLTGCRFGRLVALEIDKSKRGANKPIRWHCLCACGAKTIVASTKLRIGHTRSCGCLHRELRAKALTTHGGSGTRLYQVWAAMLARVNRPTASFYARYGGRGISVCAVWSDYAAFRDWALSHGYSPGLSIDRIDNDGNYEPSNCRWSTPLEQAWNKANNVIIEYRGKRACIAEHAREAGLDYQLVRQRVRNLGWPIDRALQTPSQRTA